MEKQGRLCLSFEQFDVLATEMTVTKMVNFRAWYEIECTRARTANHCGDWSKYLETSLQKCACMDVWAQF